MIHHRPSKVELDPQQQQQQQQQQKQPVTDTDTAETSGSHETAGKPHRPSASARRAATSSKRDHYASMTTSGTRVG